MAPADAAPAAAPAVAAAAPAPAAPAAAVPVLTPEQQEAEERSKRPKIVIRLIGFPTLVVMLITFLSGM